MHFVEILGSKSRQQNSKNFNKIALMFWHPSMPFTERNGSLYLKFYK